MEKTKALNQILGKQTRTLTIDSNEVDIENRSVWVAFSSETPVERWYGNEVLDHSPGSVDLEFFRSGAPVLKDHDPTKQIGIVETVELSDDRRGRAKVRISRAAESDWLDIQDGIKRHVSVGYSIKDAKEEGEGVYRVTDWSPFEISFVSLPADRTVGVGRDDSHTFTEQQTGENNVPDALEETAKTERAQPIEVGREKPKNDFEQRMDQILEIGNKLGEEQFAREFSVSGKTVEEFRDALRQKFEKQRGKGYESAANLDMPKSDIRRYSLLKAIDAKVKNDWRDAGLELEASREIEKRLDKEARGFFMPLDVQKRSRGPNPDIFDESMQQVLNPEKGGYLVKDHLMIGSFIEILRNECLLPKLGVTMLNNLKGTIHIPKQTEVSSTVWIDEDGEAPDRHVKFGMMKMEPKTIASAVPMSRKVLKEASIDMENFVISDMAKENALEISRAALYGEGYERTVCNEPKGLLKYEGLEFMDFDSAREPLSYRHILKLKELLIRKNALLGSPKFVGDPGIDTELRLTEKSPTTAQFLLGDNNRLIGYPFVSTNQIEPGLLIFGDFGQMMMGLWGILDILPDTSTKVASGGLVIRTFQDLDFGVRHLESFVCLRDKPSTEKPKKSKAATEEAPKL